MSISEVAFDQQKEGGLCFRGWWEGGLICQKPGAGKQLLVALFLHTKEDNVGREKDVSNLR